MLSLLFVVTAAIISAVTPVQKPPSSQLHLGDAAPAIKLEKVLQAPSSASTDWASLKGKVVVIEFWATWCSPCVGAIPHLNQLVQEFADQPVVFLSITDDDPDQLDKFLKTTQMRSWVGLDTKRVNWQPFDVHSIPTTVIVDANGRLVAETRPESVTADLLRDVLAAKKITLPALETRDANLKWDQEEIEWKDGVAPTAYVIIKPISTATGGMWPRPEGDHFTADGGNLETLVQYAYGVDHFHIDWRAPASATQYRVAARVPPGRQKELLPMFQAALVANFPLKVQWQTEEKEAYVLRIAASGKSKLPVAATDETPLYQMMRGNASAKRQTNQKLVDFLANTFGLPVVDETGLTGEYDWDLPYQHGQPDVTLKPLKDQFGLELEKARRPIKMLVVESTEVAGQQTGTN